MLPFFDIVAILLLLTACFGWLNLMVFRLPETIGLLVMGLAASLLLILVELVFPGVELRRHMTDYLRRIDLREALTDGMLPFLLFAGAITIDFSHLRSRAWDVGVMAVLVTGLSTALAGSGLWLVTSLLGEPLPWAWCFAFGALISPTDPVAVLGTLKNLKLPGDLELLLSGEALFNDGVGIVLFMTFAAIAAGAGTPSVGAVATGFATEALGGGLLGLLTGQAAYHATRRIDSYALEIMITLALVTCTYALAGRLGVSGAIAVVVAGILLGHRAPADGMSAETRRYFFGFWTLVDQMLNAMLFLLIGLEVIVLDFDASLIGIGLVSVPLVLAARFLAVAVPALLLGHWHRAPAGSIPILTWGGLHGGISVALALSLPQEAPKPLLLEAIYAVVLFSLIVQGLSLPRLVRAYTPGQEKGGA